MPLLLTMLVFDSIGNVRPWAVGMIFALVEGFVPCVGVGGEQKFPHSNSRHVRPLY